MAETAPILSLLGIGKSFVSRAVLDGVNCTVHEGDRIGLLGVNGSGKSTLLKITAGLMQPDTGEIRKRRDLEVSYLDQSFSLRDDSTVIEWIEGAFASLRRMEAELDDIHHALASAPEDPALLERHAFLSHELEWHGAYDAPARMRAAMAALGLPPGDRRIGTLSGGEKRRVALCRVLLERPHLLLLDEPTNHLDAETLEWLEEYLRVFPGTVMLVTHDRYFLDRVTNRMIELERGVLKSYAGNYGEYLLAKDIELQIGSRSEENRQRYLRKELEWLSRQPRARTTKSKARAARIKTVAGQDAVRAPATVQFRVPDAPRLGKTVLEAEHIHKSLGGRELVRGFTFTMVPGDRIGIIGRNGAGKTTLLRLLLGLERPDRGEVKHGKNVSIVYADQHRAALDPEKTVLQEVAGELDWLRAGGERISVRSFLKGLLFTDETASMPIHRLSGGERSRVLLAKLLREGGNLIALDEPTNDLDLQTLRVLEEALATFDGSCIVVSHDRYFLNRVTTRILWLPGDGDVHSIAGNYDDFRVYRERLLETRAESARTAERDESPGREAAERRRNTSRKLSYIEQREFEGIEARILEQEERLSSLGDLLDDHKTYLDRSKAEVERLQCEREEARAQVAQLYDRWAELSERAKP
ncbi:ABC-F family ATP-binding cassette domain-containing protein [Candidatus Poribacteria bacterium]|nr:ABC-F family ATP-binding cassette domain-containing protein [Candidatus Poribacteria bacterium]